VPRLGRGSHQSVRPAEDAVDGTGHPPREPGNATAARWPRGRGVSRVGRCWIASSAVTFPGFGCLVERAGRFGSGSARSRLRSRVGGWQNGGELNLAARKRAVKARFVTRGGRKALMRRVLREREGSGWSRRLRPPARHLGRPPQIERQQEWGTPVDQTAWDGRGKHQAAGRSNPPVSFSLRAAAPVRPARRGRAPDRLSPSAGSGSSRSFRDEAGSATS
jgi:hypothetical protein